MGLLDILAGNYGAVSPYSALYPSPLLAPGLQVAPGQAPNAQDAATYGMLGLDPSAIPMPVPAKSPFPETAPAPAPAPADGFGAGATPFGFAGPGSMNVTPSQIAPPAAPAPAPAPVPAPAAAAPVAAAPGAPAAPAAAPGANDDDEEAAAPAAAAPTSGTAPAAAPAPAPFSLGGAGLGDRLERAGRGFFGNMANGPLGAIAGGLGALITGKSTDPTQIAQERANATGQALMAKGASPAEVAAAANNPTLMQALINQYYGKDKWKVVQTGETPAGKIFMQQNELDGTLRPLPGQGGAGGSGGAGGMGGAGAAAFNMPESYDPKTRRDEAFIKALDPVSRQVVEAAYNGDNIPQGRNLQKFMPVIQRAIQGFDPSSYLARQSFNREMGSGKAGYGMQVSGFQQGLEHLDTLAKTWLKKANVNGLGFPDLAHFANGVREHWSNDQAGAAVSLENEGQQAAGEVGKLFSGSQGGGVHEREQTKGYLGNSRASGPEAAAGLESTLDLMMGGLSKLEQARDRAYDGNAPEKYNFLGPKQQEQIDRIRQAIQQLKSGAEAPAAAAPGARASGSVNVGGQSLNWSVR